MLRPASMGPVHYVAAHQVLLPLGIAATVALAITSMVAGRMLVLRLPVGGFDDGPEVPLSRTRALLRTVAGVALVAAGLAELFLPGPGLVLVALGALMLRPAWRARILRWLASKPVVLRQLNAVRRRHGVAELDQGAWGGGGRSA